jgi:hypothetical protein
MEIEQWPAAAVATVVAALVAAVAAVVGWMFVGRQWRADERGRRRVHYWERLSWGLTMMTSPDRRSSDLGIAIVHAVYDIPWMTLEDRWFTDHVVDQLARLDDENEEGPDG